MLQNHNGENQNLIFFRRNMDGQQKNDISCKTNFFFLFALQDAYYLPFCKDKPKGNLDKKSFDKEQFTKEKLISIIIFSL